MNQFSRSVGKRIEIDTLSGRLMLIFDRREGSFEIIPAIAVRIDRILFQGIFPKLIFLKIGDSIAIGIVIRSGTSDPSRS